MHAEHGTRSTERAALGVLLAAAMLLVPMASLSQPMKDPTQPPAQLAVEAPPAGEAVGVQAHQLQSVIISPTRKAAIINGVLVELGGTYGEAVLTRVAEDEVVLKSEGTQEVLKLHPAVEIAPAGAKSTLGKTKPKTMPNATTRREAAPAADDGGKAR